MPVNEQLMAQGGFRFQFRPDTPLETRTALGRWDTIVVTSGRIARPEGMTPAQLMAKAVFTGRIEGCELTGPNQHWELSGGGIATWLGDAKGAGDGSYTYVGATNLGIHLIAVFGPGNRTNGITLGTITGIGTNNIDEAALGEESVRTMVQRWCDMTNPSTEWRISPQGVMDFAPSTGINAYKIFPGDPGIGGVFLVVGRDFAEERNSTMVVLPIGEDGIKVRTDYTQYANVVHTKSTGGAFTKLGFANAGAGSDLGFDGVNPAYSQVWVSPLDSDASTADLNLYAAIKQAREFSTRYDYSLTVDTGSWCIADDIAPGARFYLHDPWTEQLDAANRLVIQGRQTLPKLVRCTGYEYGLRPGFGLVGIATCGGSNVVTDLSDVLGYDTEPTETTINVEQQPATLSQFIRGH